MRQAGAWSSMCELLGRGGGGSARGERQGASSYGDGRAAGMGGKHAGRGEAWWVFAAATAAIAVRGYRRACGRVRACAPVSAA